MEESGLCGIVWAVWKRVGYMVESRMCGRVWAVWNRVGYVE